MDQGQAASLLGIAVLTSLSVRFEPEKKLKSINRMISIRLPTVTKVAPGWGKKPCRICYQPLKAVTSSCFIATSSVAATMRGGCNCGRRRGLWRGYSVPGGAMRRAFVLLLASSRPPPSCSLSLCWWRSIVFRNSGSPESQAQSLSH